MAKLSASMLTLCGSTGTRARPGNAQPVAEKRLHRTPNERRHSRPKCDALTVCWFLQDAENEEAQRAKAEAEAEAQRARAANWDAYGDATPFNEVVHSEGPNPRPALTCHPTEAHRRRTSLQLARSGEEGGSRCLGAENQSS